MLRVSIIKGKSRRENIVKSLEQISDDIRRGVGDRQVVIKPNFVSTSIQLASSHIDQIRGILDFFKEFYKKRVIVAEAACGDTMDAFKNFGYHRLINEYDVELMDLNQGSYEPVSIRDSMRKPIHVRVSRLLLDEDNYLISAAKLKTHDTSVVTLSIKNMAMGSVLLFDKEKVHQGFKQTNLNIAKLAQLVWPDLSVIDGLVGMEGDGPTFGDPIHVGVAISSVDPLAADRVACEVMGIDIWKVGYLYYCSERGLGEMDLQRIDIVGEALRECVKPFRLHSTVKEQYRWRD